MIWHENAPGQANGQFGHKDDWAEFCDICKTERLHKMYYSQSPRLEKLGRNRYMATVFSLVPEKASEFILTKRQAKRAFPELMASLETFSKLNNA